MFIRTEKTFLRPLHSLLSKPFDFNAVKSLEKGPFSKGHLANRLDLSALTALCGEYDRMKESLIPHLGSIRVALESEYTFRLPVNSSFRDVCNVRFEGDLPKMQIDIDPRVYLALDHAQRQMERIYDSFHIRSLGKSDPTSNKFLIQMMRFHLLNDALVFALAGIAKVAVTGPGIFKLEPFDIEALQDLRRLWFSRSISIESSAADIVYIKKIASHAQGVTIGAWNGLLDNLLDKHFAITWRLLAPEGLALRTTQHLRQLMGLIATIQTKMLRGEVIQMNKKSLMNANLDHTFVSGVLERQYKGLVTDRFLGREGNQLISLVDASSTVLRKYAVDLANEFGEVEALRRFVGGMFFEKQTIMARLRNDPKYSDRYFVHDGFDRYQVLDDAKSETDVDFILLDQKIKHYYFIQVKYALPGQTAGFANEIKQLQNDIGDGLDQIREAKRLLTSGALAQTLANRGIDDAHVGNSSFILLHNIATYDFQVTADGIALYEWASFRNLLLDCEVSHGSSETTSVPIRMNRSMPLGAPQEIVTALFREHPIYIRQEKNIWATERAITTIDFDGIHIELHGLGI